jgi:hypothetical protein
MHSEQIEFYLAQLDVMPIELYDGVHHWRGRLLATCHDETTDYSVVTWANDVINFDLRQVKAVHGNIITLRQSSMVNG